MDLGLTDKRVLIAGASRGIGLAIAESFLREGARVILTARRAEPLEDARQALSATYADRVVAFAANMSDESVAREVLAQAGSIDVAVINFGATDTVPGFDTSTEEWERLLTANLTGPARLARLIALDMQRRKDGVILFVGSICGREAVGAPIAYGVGKAGLRQVVKSMARELAPDGVRVNLVSPGNVLFEGGRWAEKRAADSAKVDSLIAATVPMRRFGAPREIADVAVFMCSDRAAFMTGSDVVVDGGQTMGL